MKKNISKKDILALLRKNTKQLSKSPCSQRVLTFRKLTSAEYMTEPEAIDIEVSFQHPNYISIIRDLYGADQYGNIQTGMFGNNDLSYVPNLKRIIQQLENDGYIYVNNQSVNYGTEFGKKEEWDENGKNETYLAAKEFFSDEERRNFENAIHLTTKGQSWSSFWKDKFLSEPTGSLALMLSIISLVISILL